MTLWSNSSDEESIAGTTLAPEAILAKRPNLTAFSLDWPKLPHPEGIVEP